MALAVLHSPIASCLRPTSLLRRRQPPSLGQSTPATGTRKSSEARGVSISSIGRGDVVAAAAISTQWVKMFIGRWCFTLIKSAAISFQLPATITIIYVYSTNSGHHPLLNTMYNLARYNINQYLPMIPWRPHPFFCWFVYCNAHEFVWAAPYTLRTQYAEMTVVVRHEPSKLLGPTSTYQNTCYLLLRVTTARQTRLVVSKHVLSILRITTVRQTPLVVKVP